MAAGRLGLSSWHRVLSLSGRCARDKLAVLKTLASTVKRRLYALAKESGRNAAKYIIKEFPHFFDKILVEPNIPCFMPEICTPQIEGVSEEALKERVNLRMVKDSVDMFDQLLQAGTPVSLETTNSLLDLLCFYGDGESTQEKESEEKEGLEELEVNASEQETPKGQPQRRAHPSASRWRENNNAERIFKIMPERNSHSYCTMIRGMVKHGAAAKAYDMYTELLNDRHRADVHTFNALITAVPFLKDRFMERWELIKMFLNHMVQQEVQPNVRTFNAVLKVLRRCGGVGRSMAVPVIKEMEALEIEPSLATYDHLLSIFYRTVGHTPSGIISEVLDDVEGRSFAPQDPDDGMNFNLTVRGGSYNQSCLSCHAEEVGDLPQHLSLLDVFSVLGMGYSGLLYGSENWKLTDVVFSLLANFFVSAMQVCCDLKDIKLAYRLNKAVEQGDNWKFLDMDRANSYWTRFFSLLCMMEQIDVVLKWYKEMNPSLFYPSPKNILDLLQALDAANHLEAIPSVWEDIKQLGFSRRRDLLEELLSLMSRDQHPEEVQLAFAKCAEDIKTVHEQSRRDQAPVEWTGSALGSVTVLFARAGRTQDAWSMMEHFQQINRIPTDLVMDEFLSCAKQTNSPDEAIKLVKLAAALGLPSLQKLKSRTEKEFELSENQRKALESIQSDSDSSDSDSDSDRE
ncbi:hypothetical protein ASZ78_012703 [Callipepla squamata]|uniref:Small ribosomal subunit protein mS39 n=1 Tax=Callipepla squamata TaxID=9009 RepID=A0A226MG42_CALSU|nr:hypothetical protein ASZ78_012703 [Callipepla squamata]